MLREINVATILQNRSTTTMSNAEGAHKYYVGIPRTAGDLVEETKVLLGRSPFLFKQL